MLEVIAAVLMHLQQKQFSTVRDTFFVCTNIQFFRKAIGICPLLQGLSRKQKGDLERLVLYLCFVY